MFQKLKDVAYDDGYNLWHVMESNHRRYSVKRKVFLEILQNS